MLLALLILLFPLVTMGTFVFLRIDKRILSLSPETRLASKKIIEEYERTVLQGLLILAFGGALAAVFVAVSKLYIWAELAAVGVATVACLLSIAKWWWRGGGIAALFRLLDSQEVIEAPGPIDEVDK